MSENAKTEAISRRKALALAGLGTVTVLGLGLAASSVAVSEADAATVGMDRRHDRRGGRQTAVRIVVQGAKIDARTGANRPASRGPDRRARSVMDNRTPVRF